MISIQRRFRECLSSRVLLDIFLLLVFATVAACTGAAAQAAPDANAPKAQSAPAANPAPAPAASGQQPVTTMSVKVNVVNVLATVRDKHDKIVNDLSKDDFTLTEDGRPQTIHYFTRETDLPLTLGLLVDTSLSQRRVLDQERSASHGFLDQIVRADKDKAFIIHFDREVELLQDLTSDPEKLQAALSALQTPEFTRTSTTDPNNPQSDPGSQSGRGSHRGYGGGAGTLLYDAVYLASDELMRKQQGRKALIVLSDGVDRGSKESLESAISTAQRADTVVYSILFKDDEENNGNRGGFGGGGPRIGMGGPMGGGGMGRRGGGGGQRYPSEARPDGKKILERISKETGGRFFEATKKEPVDQIYSQIEEDLRNQYNIGYTPDRAADNTADYHKIVLTAKKKDMTVQARDGYYASR